MNQTFESSLLVSGISDYWRLCDELTLKQAALLIVGIDPDSEMGFKCESLNSHERPAGYGAVKQALARDLGFFIDGTRYCQDRFDINDNFIEEVAGSTDIDRSTMKVHSLVEWLGDKGVKSGFFFPKSNETPEYLDPNNARYAPKLAAAVNAWQNVTDPKGKTPKQALERWLRENGAAFGLTDDEGNPVVTAIEECSKVANWRPSGGAAKTPGA